MAISESMSRRIRAVFNTFNFWTIVLYNVLALNSLEFANLVAKRLLLKGEVLVIFEQFKIQKILCNCYCKVVRSWFVYIFLLFIELFYFTIFLIYVFF